MYIVTGGAGFIGSAVVAKLNQEGIDDIIIVDELDRSAKWKNLVGLRYNDYVHKDEFLETIYSDDLDYQLEAIIHMGACSSTTEADSDYLYDNNYYYSKLLAEYALEKDVRFIYASSAATYGDGSLGYSDNIESINRCKPLNMYGYSKQLMDQWVLKEKLIDQVVGLKFFNVFGPNEYHKEDMRSVVLKAYYQIKERGYVELFKSYNSQFADGEQKRDFIYVKDCVEVIWELLKNEHVNGIFNLGTGVARSWNDLVKAVFSALNMTPDIRYIDMPGELKDQYQYFTQADMEQFKSTGVKFNFTSLEDAIRDYVNNYLEKGSSHLIVM